MIGLGCGLAPNRRQAMTWTNEDPVHCCIIMSLDLNEFRPNDRYYGFNQRRNYVYDTYVIL